MIHYAYRQPKEKLAGKHVMEVRNWYAGPIHPDSVGSLEAVKVMK
jgi:hypothetical protein